jgi:hypothetical protein
MEKLDGLIRVSKEKPAHPPARSPQKRKERMRNLIRSLEGNIF